MIAAQIYALALGQSLLTASLLVMRARHANVYLPLAFFFFANSMAELCFILREVDAHVGAALYTPEVALCKLLIELTLPPLFWIYVRELTSERQSGWKLADSWHFILPLAPSVLLAFILLVSGGDSNHQQSTSLSRAFVLELNGVLNLAALAQFCFYVVLVIRRLKNYRRKLMELFASTKSMELNWFRGALLLLLTGIALELIAEILYAVYAMPNPFKPWNSLLRLALVWFFSVWGLRQRPDLMIEVAATDKIDDQYDGKYEKYSKSRVDEALLLKTVDKIKFAVEHEKVYRDPNLSLRILSDKINVLPSYVSQALNIKLEESFFDYINRHRVLETMARLETSDDTVLDIASAAGFNSRSSFYTAFKKVAQVTPTEYRKAYLRRVS